LSEYRLLATGALGDHRVSIPVPILPAGTYVGSLQAMPAAATKLRVQLFDQAGNVALADYDLEQQTVAVTRFGNAEHYQAAIHLSANGWNQLSLTTTLPDGNIQMALQLLDDKGRSIFAPDGEDLTVRALQLEGGQTPSRYVPTAGRSREGTLHRDGNRLVQPEALETTGVSLANAALRRGDRDATLDSEYRLTAQGPTAEHYVVLPVWRMESGSYTLSLDARGEAATGLRVQLLDGKKNGGIADTLLCATCAISTIRLGQTDVLEASQEPEPDGWFHIALTTTLAHPGPIVIVQLLDGRGAGNFSPDGEAVRLRHLDVEPTPTVTGYGVTTAERPLGDPDRAKPR
jgi:hypothetical protein